MPIRSCPKARLETLGQGSSLHRSGGSSSHHGWQDQDLLPTQLSGGCNRLLTQGLHFAVLWDTYRETAPTCSPPAFAPPSFTSRSFESTTALTALCHFGDLALLPQEKPASTVTGRFKRCEQTANSSILMQPLNSENSAFLLPQTHFCSLGLNFWATFPMLTEVTTQLYWQAWQTCPLVQPSQDSKSWETYAHIFLLHNFMLAFLAVLVIFLEDCLTGFSRSASWCGISYLPELLSFPWQSCRLLLTALHYLFLGKPYRNRWISKASSDCNIGWLSKIISPTYTPPVCPHTLLHSLSSLLTFFLSSNTLYFLNTFCLKITSKATSRNEWSYPESQSRKNWLCGNISWYF